MLFSPMVRGVLLSVMEMLFTPSTVTSTAAFFVASAVLVAVMVALPGATAVTSPVDSSTCATLSSDVNHFTVVATSPTTSTVALKVLFSSTFRGVLLSVMAMRFTPSTVTSTVAFLVASAVLVAVMVALPGATAVTSPVVSSTCATFSSDVDHFTVVATSPTTSTVALKELFSATLRGVLLSVMAMLFTPSRVTSQLAIFVGSSLLVAVMVTCPGARAVSSPEFSSIVASSVLLHFQVTLLLRSQDFESTAAVKVYLS